MTEGSRPRTGLGMRGPATPTTGMGADRMVLTAWRAKWEGMAVCDRAAASSSDGGGPLGMGSR